MVVSYNCDFIEKSARGSTIKLILHLQRTRYGFDETRWKTAVILKEMLLAFNLIFVIEENAQQYPADRHFFSNAPGNEKAKN